MALLCLVGSVQVLPVGAWQLGLLQELDGPTRVAPGPLGGVITPMAFADGVVYVPVVNSPATYVPDRPNFVTDFSIDGGEGVVVALDAASGSVRWETVLDDSSSNFGGATVVNDLVLTSTINGMLYALDRATGAVVWTYEADGQVNGWPAVAGDLVVWPVGFADDPHWKQTGKPPPSWAATVTRDDENVQHCRHDLVMK